MAQSVIPLSTLFHNAETVRQFPLFDCNNKANQVGFITLAFTIKIDTMLLSQSHTDSTDEDEYSSESQTDSSLESYCKNRGAIGQSAIAINRLNSFDSLQSSTSTPPPSFIFSAEVRGGLDDTFDLIASLKTKGWAKMLIKLSFTPAYSMIRALYTDLPIPNTGKAVTDISILERASYFMKFSLPTYGTSAMYYFGYTKGIHDVLLLKSSRKTAMQHLKMKKEDLLVWRFDGKMYQANFMACYDPNTNAIIVTVRGTYSIAELILDTNIEYHGFLNGFAHKGMVQAVQEMEENYLEKFIQWTRERNAGAIYFVGHSLGGAIVSLFLIKNRPKFIELFGPDFKCEATNFATPACASPNLTEGTEEYITSYINQNDIFPHCSYGGLMDLRDLIKCAMQLSHIKNMTAKERLDKLKTYRINLKASDKHPRIAIPGKLYYIYKKNKSATEKHHVVVEETHNEFFEDISIRKRMIQDHFVNEYDQCIKQARDYLNLSHQ